MMILKIKKPAKRFDRPVRDFTTDLAAYVVMRVRPLHAGGISTSVDGRKEGDMMASIR